MAASSTHDEMKKGANKRNSTSLLNEVTKRLSRLDTASRDVVAAKVVEVAAEKAQQSERAEKGVQRVQSPAATLQAVD